VILRARLPMSGGKVTVTELHPERGPPGERIPPECREALEMWLRWDEQYRQLTERLFDGTHNARHLEEQLDYCDALRQQAVRKTRRLLATAGRD
jgi:hypothetical protein